MYWISGKQYFVFLSQTLWKPVNEPKLLRAGRFIFVVNLITQNFSYYVIGASVMTSSSVFLMEHSIFIFNNKFSMRRLFQTTILLGIQSLKVRSYIHLKMLILEVKFFCFGYIFIGFYVIFPNSGHVKTVE